MKNLLVFSQKALVSNFCISQATILLILIFIAKTSLAITVTSAGTGNWNNAGTWSPSGVPASSDDVVIASGDVITLDISTTCKSLTFTSGSSGAILYVSSNNLIVTGGIVMNGTNQTSGTNPTIISITSGSVTCASLAFNIDNGNVSSSTNYSQLSIESGGLSVTGNITLNYAITGSGKTGINVVTGNWPTINVGGSFMTTTGYFSPANCTVNYNGTSQTISAYSYYNLTLSNGSTLGGNVTILTNGVLTLNGTVTTTASNLLTINLNAYINSASSTNYINGPLKKIGNNNFTFPIGENGNYAPCEVNNSGGNSTDEYTAEYFNSGYSDLSVSGITNVSSREYWTINRTSGTSNPTIILHYEDGSYSGITATPSTTNLFIARYNGSDWVAASGGANGVSGNTSNGTASLTSVTAFGTFTFGSDNSQPLPVKLIKFDAKVVDRKVFLRWTTSTEVNNDYFEIEKSLNGIDFQKIGRVKGNGNSSQIVNYQFIDSNLILQKTFYRLKQVDFNEEFSYSGIRKVDYENIMSAKLIVYPNPTTSSITVTGEEDAIFQILNVYGQIILESDLQNIDLSGYSPGVYILKIKNDRGSTPAVKILLE